MDVDCPVHNECGRCCCTHSPTCDACTVACELCSDEDEIVE